MSNVRPKAASEQLIDAIKEWKRVNRQPNYKALAEAAGVDESTIYRLLSKKRKGAIETFDNLCRALDLVLAEKEPPK